MSHEFSSEMQKSTSLDIPSIKQRSKKENPGSVEKWSALSVHQKNWRVSRKLENEHESDSRKITGLKHLYLKNLRTIKTK